MVLFKQVLSPIGTLTLYAQDDALCEVRFEKQKYVPLPWQEAAEGSNAVLIAAEAFLDEYWAGRRPSMTDLPLCPRGSIFQQKVWKELCTIPYGQTITYGQLASRVFTNQKACPQAVGGAVGRNPLPIFIPCHRVLGANRKLTGYNGGLAIKKALLDLEGVFYRE